MICIKDCDINNAHFVKGENYKVKGCGMIGGTLYVTLEHPVNKLVRMPRKICTMHFQQKKK